MTFLLCLFLWFGFGIGLALIKLHNGLLGDIKGEFTGEEFHRKERFYYHAFFGPIIVIRDITLWPLFRSIRRLNKYLDSYGKTTE